MLSKEEQIRRFETGFPWLDIVAPATPQKGIQVLSEADAKAAAAYYEKASVKGKCKFVPASGAASRMFKDMFAGLSALEAEPVARRAAQSARAERKDARRRDGFMKCLREKGDEIAVFR